MADFTQTIENIEKEIRETPYHKGTEHHIGILRARLARIKDKIIESGIHLRQGSGGQGGGYAVKKTGDVSVVLVGPPSSGKSTLLNKLTNAESKVAEYPFTTTSVIPGMMFYQDAYIQIFDIPGLIEGASHGKGRGKEVLSVARNSDLIIILSDIQRANQIEKILAELEGAGIRINKKRPKVLINKKPVGGITIHSNIRQGLGEKTIKEIASEMGIKNADISLREKITVDSLIDAFSASRVYLPAIFVINKIDINYQPLAINYLGISAEKGIALDNLKDEIWKKLELVRVYLVHPDEEPNLENPMIMKKGEILRDVALKIGTDFAENKKFAKIWGVGAHFPGQEVSLTTKVLEGMKVRFL